jgi:hypothetical protein
MSKHGGARPGAGRKSKFEEQRITELISPYRSQILQTVVDIMQTAEKDADRLAAAKLLMAYDWGTPKQSIDHTTKGESINTPDLSKLTDDELRTIAALQRKSGISE